MSHAEEISLFTVGHSSRSADELVELLRTHAIANVVDVRSAPYSKYVPHFSKEPLRNTLAAAGLGYAFMGRALGGRPDGREFYDADGHVDYARRMQAPDFLAGIEALLRLVRSGPTVVMCAEENPNRCHRRRLITPVVMGHGVEVLHIRRDGTLQDEAALADAQLALF